MKIKDLLDLISNEDLDEIFNILLEKYDFNSKLSSKIRVIKGNYQDLKTKEIAGTIDYSNLQLGRNQVRYSLINLILGNESGSESVPALCINDYFPEFSINPKLELVLDLLVARDMEPVSSFNLFLWSVYSGIRRIVSLFSSEEKYNYSADNGYVARNFDWDGLIVLTGCDGSLAVNVWSVRNKTHLSYSSRNKESYATMFVQKCGMGEIFGNGLFMYYSEDGRVRQEFNKKVTPFDIGRIIMDRNEGREINSIITEDGSMFLGMFKRTGSFMSDFAYSKIDLSPFMKNGNSGSWNIVWLDELSSSLRACLEIQPDLLARMILQKAS
ncbi:hypothetical protein [Pontibacter sp. G13]|uniref:hypothetical protein n=1 Tax=Pontibacter sp. G13 TaxID=3074898 RepID=UPI00288B2B72|nr:hypothetical protein [Pontibacter sp. G13]WNJ17572.1 hypothetical protein RJD25_22205 [Pontibacter sp. G13]